MSSFSRITRSLALLFIMGAVFSLTSCKKSQPKPDENAVPSAANADENSLGDSDSGKAMGLQTVNFPFDAFNLDETARRKLMQNVQILKDKSSINVQVEGHCDEKGGIQYNIALGEKRANAVRKYLVDQGIAGNRVTTISFGKERPLDPASNEAAWAKNRRANFVITSR